MTLEGLLNLDQAIASAIAHHQAGRADAAEAGYRQILAAHPTQFDALHLLGVLHHQRGQHREAVELIRHALTFEPLAYPALFNLGRAHSALDELDAARACFERAAQLNPDYPEAHESLAAIRARQGDPQGELNEYERVVSLRPEWSGAHNNLGCALHKRGQFAAARASLLRALELDPQNAMAAFNLGELVRGIGGMAECIEHYRRATALKPDLVQAYYILGIALHTQGLREEALACERTAQLLNPEHVESRWAIAMLQLPLVHGVGESRDDSRASFARELTALDAWFQGPRVDDGYRAVGSQQPFYLAYHDHSNVELLSIYGDLCARLMRHWYERRSRPTSQRANSGCIRLAIVSGHLFDHSVWTAITRGFVEQLDRERFSVHLFYTGIVDHRETAQARSSAASFIQGSLTLGKWVDAMEELQPDAILYPEIGMDTMTARLAALRLAPIQLASWGQPMTIGLPTIDYFLSAAAFEPENGAQHYRERLIALPNLGCCYRRLGLEPKAPDVTQWGVEPGMPLLLCAGTPYKYAPERDTLLVEIARRLGRARLVFFTDIAPPLSHAIQYRLGLAFRDGGLDPARFLTLIPRQERAMFFGAMKRADVYLDTLGFSGFNTAMQAIECGLPIVAHWGQFMRGRLAAGILARMGMADLVARTDAEYVNLAVKLCQDPGYRAQVRERIERSRHILFDDTAPVRALEELLVGLTRNSRGAGTAAMPDTGT